jgi:anti-sigma-K factor RskA
MSDDQNFEPEGTESDAMDDFADVELVLRSMTGEDAERRQPPSDLWAGIEAQTTRQAGSHPEVFSRAEDTAQVSSMEEARRRRRPVLGTAVAAAAAVLVLVVGIAVTRDAGSSPIAEATLTFDASAFDPLGAEARAAVTLVEDDGTLHVRVDESSLPDAAEADLELWLIQPDAEGNPADLVSLGIIDPANPDRFDIPAGYDPDVYFVVDISIEPRDGDPTHSGRSILRGALVEV